MNGTVKQFKDTLEEMKTIYPYEDDKTYIQTRNDLVELGHNNLCLVNTDEKTGVLVELSKKVVRNDIDGKQ